MMVTGLETRMDASPSATVRARRSSVSASGPSTTAISTGASGNWYRRITKPSRPIANSTHRSRVAELMAYTPSMDSTVMPA